LYQSRRPLAGRVYHIHGVGEIVVHVLARRGIERTPAYINLAQHYFSGGGRFACARQCADYKDMVRLFLIAIGCHALIKQLPHAGFVFLSLHWRGRGTRAQPTPQAALRVVFIVQFRRCVAIGILRRIVHLYRGSASILHRALSVARPVAVVPFVPLVTHERRCPENAIHLRLVTARPECQLAT